MAKRTYFLIPRSEARIHLQFHYAPRRITASWREFFKDNSPPTVVQVDPFKPAPKVSDPAHVCASADADSSPPRARASTRAAQ